EGCHEGEGERGEEDRTGAEATGILAVGEPAGPRRGEGAGRAEQAEEADHIASVAERRRLQMEGECDPERAERGERRRAEEAGLPEGGLGASEPAERGEELGVAEIGRAHV